MLVWTMALALATAVGPAAHAASGVAAATGRLTVEEVDHELPTPLGPIPVTRHYRDGARPSGLGRGWALDIAVRVEILDERRALVVRGNAPIGALESRDGRTFSGEGRWQAEREGTQWRLRWPDDTASLCDASGREISRTDANGNTVAFAYDGAGRVARASAASDRGLTFAYGDSGLLAEIRDAAGRTAAYRYDAAGNLVEVVGSDALKTTYRYGSDGRLARIVEPSGETIALSYDPRGRVAERTSSRTGRLTFSYGAATRVARDDGYWTETAYDEQGAPVSSVDSLGNRQSWTWNRQRQLVAATYADGSAVSFDYDGSGRVVAQRTSRGRTLAFGYDGDSLRPRTLDTDGVVTRFAYDGHGNLTEATSPAGRTVRFAYDAQGRRIASTDGAGRTTRFEYDSGGHVIRRSGADGGITIWEYTPAGRPARERDAGGNTWSYGYTAQGWLAAVVGPRGRARAFEYDAAGRVAAEKEGGLATRYRYDDAGRLAATEADDGTRLAFAYDARGNLARVSDERGRSIAIESDALGRPVRTTLASGALVTRTYAANGALASIAIGRSRWSVAADPDGRATRIVDATGGTVRATRDAFGRIAAITLAGGGRELRRYDPDGLVDTVTSPTGDAWKFAYGPEAALYQVGLPDGGSLRLAYDAAGRLAGLTQPWGGRVVYSYDALGQLLRRTDAAGRNTEYRYDGDGRVVAKKTPDAEWTYRYDADGRLVEATGADYTVRHDYDRFGRIVRTAIPQWKTSVAYAYDTNGRLAARTGPDGKVVRYLYDALGRTSTIETASGRFAFTYDDLERVVRRRAPNGTTTSFEFDDAGRVTAVTHDDAGGKPLAARRYRYDADGNRTEIADEQGRVGRYRYDRAGQLIAEEGAGESREYGVGPAGNRTTSRAGAAAAEYRYDAGGRLIQAGEAGFEYDADGNLTARRDASGTTRYRFDAEGNLIRVELPSGRTVTYGYGPFGERIWRDGDGRRTYYVYDGDDVLAELSESFDPVQSYLYADVDQPLMVTMRGGVAHFVHQDEFGTTLALSDAAGRPSGRYALDAFGNVLRQEGAATGLAARYAGRPLDAATGLYDMRARFYDPKLGRFISPDPLLGRIDDPASFAPYPYARNNPLRYADPFGAQWVVDVFNRPVVGMTWDASYLAWGTHQLMGPERPLPPLALPFGRPAPNFPNEYFNAMRTQPNAVPHFAPRNVTVPYARSPQEALLRQRQAEAAAQPTLRRVAAAGAAAQPAPQSGPGGGTVIRGQAAGGGLVASPGGTATAVGSAAGRGAAALRAVGGSVEAAALPYVNTAQRLGTVAGRGLTAIRMADIAGEALASDDPGEVLADRGLEFAALTATSAAMAPVTGLIASTAPAAVTVGGAVVGAAALTYAAGERSLAAMEAHQERDLAEQRAARAEQAQQAQQRDLLGQQKAILDGLRGRLAEARTKAAELASILEDLRERRSAVTNRGNRAISSARQAAALRMAAAQERRASLDASSARFEAALDAAGGKLAEASSAAAEACASEAGASTASERLARASAAARRAARLAAEAKTSLPLPLDLEAARLLAQDTNLPSSEYNALADSAASDVAAIDAHVAAMEGRAAQYDRDVARVVTLRDDVRQRAARLTLFDELKAEAAAIAADAGAVAVPAAGEAQALLAEARRMAGEARAAHGRISTPLVASSVGDNLHALDRTGEALRQKADAVAGRAEACVTELLAASTPPPTTSSCTRDVDCPIGSVCGAQGVCVKEPQRDAAQDSSQGIAAGTGTGATGSADACRAHSDCADGYACVNGKCVKAASPAEVTAGFNRDASRGTGAAGSTGGTVIGTMPGPLPGRFGSGTLQDAMRDRGVATGVDSGDSRGSRCGSDRDCPRGSRCDARGVCLPTSATPGTGIAADTGSGGGSGTGAGPGTGTAIGSGGFPPVYEAPLPTGGAAGVFQRYRIERIEQMYQPGTNKRCTSVYNSYDYVRGGDLAGYRQRTAADFQAAIRNAMPDARVHKIVVNLYSAPLPKDSTRDSEKQLPPDRSECR